MKKFTAISIILINSALFSEDECGFETHVPCFPDSCKPCYCYGPISKQGNAPARPYTCNGDIEIAASILYWKASQDGMACACKVDNAIFGNASVIGGEYITPHFQPEIGYRFNVGYHSPCDGWDLGIEFTSFQGRGTIKEEVEEQVGPAGPFPITSAPTGQKMIVLWSGAATAFLGFPLAGKIEGEWAGNILIGDILLGREFWASQRFTLRPHLGIRLLSVDQNLLLTTGGGSWQEFVFDVSMGIQSSQPALIGEMKFKNKFSGVGCVGGLDTHFHFNCGWSLYGTLAGSIIYGQFEVKDKENIRVAESPFAKIDMVDTKDCFKVSRGVLDSSLGIEWASLICDCKYVVTVQLGWEQHPFFHQNQFWTVNRDLKAFLLSFNNVPPPFPSTRNNLGENNFVQQRGTLATNGLTFTFKFDF